MKASTKVKGNYTVMLWMLSKFPLWQDKESLVSINVSNFSKLGSNKDSHRKAGK